MIMKNFSKHIILLAAFVSIISDSFAQDPNFSMFYNNPSYYNPAMVAIGNGFTFRLNGRNLWTPIPSKFNTVSASIEAEAVNKIGLGLQAYSDVAGEGFLRTTGANFQYMYRPLESKNVLLQLGFSAGFVNKYIDWNKLTFSDQYDEVFGLVKESAFNSPNFRSVSYADFGSGFALRFNGKQKRNKRLFKKMNGTLGGSVHHLTTPKDAFLGVAERLPMKFVGHTSFNFLVSKVIFSPAIIYERQNKFETFTLGLNVVNKPFFAGFWFRNRNYLLSGNKFDSFIISTGVTFSPRQTVHYRFAYSFDMTVSRLRTSSIGTHEISIVIDYDNKLLFQKRQNAKKAREKYKCPEDFKVFE